MVKYHYPFRPLDKLRRLGEAGPVSVHYYQQGILVDTVQGIIGMYKQIIVSFIFLKPLYQAVYGGIGLIHYNMGLLACKPGTAVNSQSRTYGVKVGAFMAHDKHFF